MASTLADNSSRTLPASGRKREQEIRLFASTRRYDCKRLQVGTVVNGVAERQRTKVVVELVFRSPEAVLRAVGEMVRHQGLLATPTLAVCADGTANCTGRQKQRVALFQVAKKRDRSALLAVRFMDQDYSIPESEFRSML